MSRNQTGSPTARVKAGVDGEPATATVTVKKEDGGWNYCDREQFASRCRVGGDREDQAGRSR